MCGLTRPRARATAHGTQPRGAQPSPPLPSQLLPSLDSTVPSPALPHFSFFLFFVAKCRRCRRRPPCLSHVPCPSSSFLLSFPRPSSAANTPPSPQIAAASTAIADRRVERSALPSLTAPPPPPLPTTNAIALLSGDVHHGLPYLSPASTIHHQLLLHADAGCRRDVPSSSPAFLLSPRTMPSPFASLHSASATAPIVDILRRPQEKLPPPSSSLLRSLLLSLPQTSTAPLLRPPSSSLSWPTTRRLLLSPSSPSLPPVTSPVSSPSALIPQPPTSVAERHHRRHRSSMLDPR